MNFSCILTSTSLLLGMLLGFTVSASPSGALCSHVLQMNQFCFPASSSSSLIGRVGKSGARGPKGDAGVKGEPGPVGPCRPEEGPGIRGPPGKSAEVDYNRIGAWIDQKLEAAYERIAILEELVTWYQASNGYFYKVFKQGNYTDGLKKCMKYGARLAVNGIINVTVRSNGNGNITNLAHANFDRELLDKLIIPSGESTFIGLDDRAQEGTFVWLDGREYSPGDVNFYPGEPNNAAGNQDCAISAKFYNWKFDDLYCHDRINYLCEKLA